jgi:hypothetical protein
MAGGCGRTMALTFQTQMLVCMDLRLLLLHTRFFVLSHLVRFKTLTLSELRFSNLLDDCEDVMDHRAHQNWQGPYFVHPRVPQEKQNPALGSTGLAIHDQQWDEGVIKV